MNKHIVIYQESRPYPIDGDTQYPYQPLNLSSGAQGGEGWLSIGLQVKASVSADLQKYPSLPLANDSSGDRTFHPASNTSPSFLLRGHRHSTQYPHLLATQRP